MVTILTAGGLLCSLTYNNAKLIMKIAQAGVGAIVLTLFSAVDVRAQNVGIGVSNPLSKLTVNGNLAIGADYNVAAPSNGALIEGNTGIGITAPQVPLHVDGEVFVSPGGVTGNFWQGNANVDGIQFDPSGFIGAQRGAGSPLHLSKPATYSNNEFIIFSKNVAAIGDVTTDGTSVRYNTTSDIRLKENIRPTSKGLNDLMRIQINDYNFKSKPGTNETGFIAQQLYTVLPEAVNPGGANPAVEPWTVDYGRVTPLLTKAIQDQQVEIDALKAQNKNQEAAFKTENAKETALEKEDAELKVRMIEQDKRIAALDDANASLTNEVAQLKAANQDLTSTAAKIEALEKMMAVLQKGEKNGVQIAALEKQ
jgi:hypothetical protein